MSKNRKVKQNQQETSVIQDICGCNILDINGVHTVNFTYEISANDQSDAVKFEGDIDFLIPYNLAKNQKLPKIEISHPTTSWKATTPVQIDDNFINAIKEKRLIYKFMFTVRPVGAHKSSQRLQNSGKKGQQQQQSSIVQVPTLFFDASILLLRGGRFKPVLSCSSSYDFIPGFSNFTVTISIDHPLLSDAQIRKFQPLAFLIKNIHQIPDKPLSFDELKENKFLPPYLIVNALMQSENLNNSAQKPLISTSSNTNLKNTASGNLSLKNAQTSSSSNFTSTSTISYSTISNHYFTDDIKLSIPLLFWGDQKNSIKEIQIELHDRENKYQEGKIMIGSGFIAPEPKVEPNQQSSSIPELSLEIILDVQKDSIPHPYGDTKIECKPGRFLSSIRPFIQRNSSIIQTPFYIESGTYVTCEVEDLALQMPSLPQSVQNASTKNKSAGRKSLNNSANIIESNSKKNSKSLKPILFNRFVVISKSNEDREFISRLQGQIIEINSKVFDQKDASAVAMMKIDSLGSEAVSGTIQLFQPDSQIIFLEAIQDSEAVQNLTCFFEKENNASTYFDNEQLFTERLYWQYDSAVKKFKLADPINHLLQDPDIYMQKSHLSNCYLILNQINQLLQIKTFNDITKNGLWPQKEDFEMLNAKKGQLLTLEELQFSTVTPEIKNIRTARFQSEISLKEAPRENLPVFTYVPVSHNAPEAPVHDLEYYETLNKQYIADLDRRIPKTKGLINVADDGESEIWDTSVLSNSRAGTALSSVYDGRSICTASSVTNGDDISASVIDNDWEIVHPEDFRSLASEASTRVFVSRLREENGSEVKNGKPFYYFRSPKSAMSRREDLLVDVNQEPWTDGDLSLANCNQRWLKQARGEVLSNFKNVAPEQELFNVPVYQSQIDKYRPKTTIEKRNYVAKPMKHKKRFYGVISPINKNEPIRKGQIETPPLTLEEPYVDRVKKKSSEIQGKPRFENIYRTPLRKGETDSLAVRKIQENTLPKIKL